MGTGGIFLLHSLIHRISGISNSRQIQACALGKLIIGSGNCLGRCIHHQPVLSLLVSSLFLLSLLALFALLSGDSQNYIGHNIFGHINRKIIRCICFNNTLDPAFLYQRNLYLPASNPGRTGNKPSLLCTDSPLIQLLPQKLPQTFGISDLSILHRPLGNRYAKTLKHPSLTSGNLHLSHSDLCTLSLNTQKTCHPKFLHPSTHFKNAVDILATRYASYIT